MVFREEGEKPRWTFLTNHAHVLVCIARDSGSSLRAIAAAVGITERATQTIVNDLEAAGYLERRRVGRRNEYALHPELPLRHPLERDHAVGELIAAVTSPLPAESRTRPRASRRLNQPPTPAPTPPKDSPRARRSTPSR